jgi:hypothetical protein
MPIKVHKPRPVAGILRTGRAVREADAGACEPTEGRSWAASPAFSPRREARPWRLVLWQEMPGLGAQSADQRIESHRVARRPEP